MILNQIEYRNIIELIFFNESEAWVIRQTDKKGVTENKMIFF